jgi:hypothetical protein
MGTSNPTKLVTSVYILPIALNKEMDWFHYKITCEIDLLYYLKVNISYNESDYPFLNSLSPYQHVHFEIAFFKAPLRHGFETFSLMVCLLNK